MRKVEDQFARADVTRTSGREFCSVESADGAVWSYMMRIHGCVMESCKYN